MHWRTRWPSREKTTPENTLCLQALTHGTKSIAQQWHRGDGVFIGSSLSRIFEPTKKYRWNLEKKTSRIVVGPWTVGISGSETFFAHILTMMGYFWCSGLNVGKCWKDILQNASWPDHLNPPNPNLRFQVAMLRFHRRTKHASIVQGWAPPRQTLLSCEPRQRESPDFPADRNPEFSIKKLR